MNDDIVVYEGSSRAVKHGIGADRTGTGIWYYEIYSPKGDKIGIGQCNSKHGASIAAGKKLSKWRNR